MVKPFSIIENIDNFPHEDGSIILEFGDLDVEANRVAFVEAMILDRVLPVFNGEGHRLETVFMSLPRGTMNKVIATRAKLYEAFREKATLLLEGFQRNYERS